MALDIPRLKFHNGYTIKVPNRDFIGKAFGLSFLDGECTLKPISNLAPKEEKAARVQALYECFNAGYSFSRDGGEEMEFIEPGEMTVKDAQFPEDVPIEERILALLQVTNGPQGPTKEDFDEAVKTAVSEQFAAMKDEAEKAEKAEATA